MSKKARKKTLKRNGQHENILQKEKVNKIVLKEEVVKKNSTIKQKESKQKNHKKSEEYVQVIQSLQSMQEEISKLNKKSRTDKFMSWIPLFSFLVALIIGYFTLQISNNSYQLSKENQGLTYENYIQVIEDKATTYEEDVDGTYKVILPIELETTIKSGKAKSIYVVTLDREEPTGYRFLRFPPEKSREFELSVTGSKEAIRKFPLDFFAFYIDMHDNISFEYIVLYPKYKDLHYEINGATRNKPIMQKSQYLTFNNYDLITGTIYDESVRKHKKKNYGTKSYSEVVNHSTEISRIIKDSLYVVEGTESSNNGD